jgi:hypothetical protein
MIMSRRMKWAGHIVGMGRRGMYICFLVGKPERKRPLGRPRRRWEDNIKMELREIGRVVWTGLNWLKVRANGRPL